MNNLITLNDYIVGHLNSPEDSSFLRRFDDVEVFFSLKNSAEPIRPGSQEDRKEPLEITLANSEIGRMALFYTYAKDPRLSDPYAGISLSRAAEMVMKMPGVDGLIIQTLGEPWFGADQAALKAVYEARPASRTARQMK